MMEDGWSARRVARQVDRSDLTVRRCWDHWTEETSREKRRDRRGRPGSECPRHSILREDRPIIRHAREEITVSLAAVQTQGSTFPTGSCVFSNHRKVPG
ncbi:hypothetical protein TNCV_5113321 [Trichonephila clavipes]|nr:hypothetical protein TNCV_5113321 [Trichonephila clavipes]